MLHGKWYKGMDDLSVLNRQIEPKDRLLWHLQITQDGETIGYCRVSPAKDAWTIDVLEYTSTQALDLLLRQVERKAQEFGVSAINSNYFSDLQAFGFKKTGENAMIADPIILPVYCKE